jgi:aminoglycoside phosphotransferase family enzyme
VSFSGYREVYQYETHISRVLVAGGYAYKFKKALRLPFLDFSTLEARRFFCHEECRLNRCLASDLYVDVVPVGGSAARPVLERAGTGYGRGRTGWYHVESAALILLTFDDT